MTVNGEIARRSAVDCTWGRSIPAEGPAVITASAEGYASSTVNASTDCEADACGKPERVDVTVGLSRMP